MFRERHILETEQKLSISEFSGASYHDNNIASQYVVDISMENVN